MIWVRYLRFQYAALAIRCKLVNRYNAVQSWVLWHKTSKLKNHRGPNTAPTTIGRSCKTCCSPNTLQPQTLIKTLWSLSCFLSQSSRPYIHTFTLQWPSPFASPRRQRYNYLTRCGHFHLGTLLDARWYRCTVRAKSILDRQSVYGARSLASGRWHFRTRELSHS